MTFRKAVFWVHLAAALLAGLVIAIMAFTGMALAFEKEIIAWAGNGTIWAVRRAIGTGTMWSASGLRPC
jgi:uncharacterized iron-regulated membrane protein